MPISPYLHSLREKVGNQLLMVPSASALIFNEAGHVLLAWHTDRQLWATVGGAIDPFERPEEAVVREVRGELGVTVEPLRLIGAFSGPEFLVEYPNGDRTIYLAVAYHCRITSGQLQPDGEEITEARYFPPSELATLPMPEHARMMVNAAIATLGLDG
ncbi:MAG: NUDIX domain-containing protein [Chlorobi bacterium CHB2]|nr:NUDIX domain-containing protein [Chlorobi bacterium CHB2]